MPGKIQIKLGDIFGGPCDLIVLPCSTTGTVTKFVLDRLQNYDIPKPPRGLKLGEIELLPFKGGENIAQFVVFAVSVDSNYSELLAIEKIGKRIGELTINNSALQIIHIPLLGAGAGNLQSERVVEALKHGFQSKSSDSSTLIIHVLDYNIFNRITKHFKGVGKSELADEQMLKSSNQIRVFISWTKTNDKHREWTEGLAKFLRENGINARIDMWHLKTGMDLPQFMINELSLANKVIIISNEQYAAKADGRTGGVGWETMIIQGDMAKQPADSLKYITIVKCNNLNDGLPIYLQTKYVIHWGSQTSEVHNRQRLLSELLNIVEEPPIGVTPVYL